MSHLTHSDGIPVPRRTTRTMFHSRLNNHAGDGVFAKPPNAATPPHVAANRLGTTDELLSKWMSQTPHRAFVAASTSIRSHAGTFSMKYRPPRQP